MSSWGKISLLLSGFCLIIMAATRSILGVWHPILYVFLGLFVLGLVVSLILDFRFYLDFFSMKTTKNGLSLGWSLMLLIILLIAFGYLGNKFNKSFDLTEEGINSLSEQTQDILNQLEYPLTIRIFFKGDKVSEKALSLKQQLKESLSLYKQKSSNIKVLYIDTYKDNLMAEKYLKDLTDKNSQEVFVFMDYEGKRVRVDGPFVEEKITSSIIKVKKRSVKEIYFLVGHGERDLQNDQPDGLKAFSHYLNDSGFLLKEWNFIKDGVPQEEPPLVLIVGPRRPFLEAELNWLKKYLSKGGKIFLAIDPKEQHNLTPFLKNYGVIFKNDFIVSQIGLLYGGLTKALGVSFDQKNPITKKFFGSKKDAVFFERASSLDITPSSFNQFKYSYLVRSHDKSFTIPELKKDISIGDMKPLTMALEIHPKMEEDEGYKDHEDHEDHEGHKGHKHKEGEFCLVVFGDSDFLTNRYFYEGVNKDLGLNAAVSLLGEEGLVTIRPKQPKGTKVTLTRIHRVGIIFLVISLPLVFLITGLFLWYRRREA